jgi:acyl carrier protein
MEIEAQVRKYILENFMYSDDQSRLTSDLSLIDNGIVDSTGVLELVGFIEETFGFKVDDADLVPDNFDSLAKMTAYIERRRTGA